jgi:hypothetical protein
MNFRLISRAIMLVTVVFLPITAVGQDQPELVGTWEGSIRTPGSERVVTMKIEVTGGRDLTGTILMPAQGEGSHSLGEIEVRDQYVSFEVEGLNGGVLFDGALAVDGNSISGNVSEGEEMFPFELTRREVGSADESDDASVLVGAWSGTLDVGGFTMEISVQIPTGSAEGVTVIVGSPGREDREMAVDSFTFQEGSVRLSVVTLGAFFAGTLNESGNQVSGTWRQADARLPLTLEKTN